MIHMKSQWLPCIEAVSAVLWKSKPIATASSLRLIVPSNLDSSPHALIISDENDEIIGQSAQLASRRLGGEQPDFVRSSTS